MDPVYINVINLLLGWVFLSAAWHKIRRPDHFQTVLESYRLLPFQVRTVHALIVATVEAMIGLGVLFSGVRTAVVVASIIVLIVYASAIGFNLVRGRTEIDCGCSGPGGYQPISWYLVARNLVLAALAAATLIAADVRSLGWIDWMTIAFAGFLAAMVYQGAAVLLENHFKLNELRRGA